jgi:outer membrane protein OmpA-like peptidoglycan-associated protein
MKNHPDLLRSFPRQLAVAVLASAIGIPAWAQSQPADAATQSGSQPAAVGTTQSGTDIPASAAEQSQPVPNAAVPAPPKEGFWGRVNPLARKKWVNRQLAPINDQLSELDQVNAQNVRDIKDVDSRAQAGIHQAQSTADAANQTAMAAGSQAQNADATAQQASNRVNQLNTTVSGLDQYHQVSAMDVKFHGESPALTANTRQQLDQLATSLAGKDGYILEIEAHSPLGGGAGIQTSQHLAEAVERYLVTEHQIPVYRMHSVALGNAQTALAGDDGAPQRVRTGVVQIRLMENSLAAQAAASPQGVVASTGTERP